MSENFSLRKRWIVIGGTWEGGSFWVLVMVYFLIYFLIGYTDVSTLWKHCWAETYDLFILLYVYSA